MRKEYSAPEDASNSAQGVRSGLGCVESRAHYRLVPITRSAYNVRTNLSSERPYNCHTTVYNRLQSPMDVVLK